MTQRKWRLRICFFAGDIMLLCRLLLCLFFLLLIGPKCLVAQEFPEPPAPETPTWTSRQPEAKTTGANDGKSDNRNDQQPRKQRQKKARQKQKDARSRTAYTRLQDVDKDFAYQGEFAGHILPDDTFDTQGLQRIGLQVVALGDGNFKAVRYPNGLPGAGWYRGDKEQLTGKRDGDTLNLDGKLTQISIINGRASVRSKTGNLLGEFLKTQRTSPTLGAAPPANAIVLFDGTNADHFKNGRILADGSLQMGTQTVAAYQDFTLHIEFQLPYMPHARGQGRSNSGIYMLSRYELQVLDSFGLDGAFNECGALYRYQKPNVNMCLPPLTWQTYDITFFSPKFDAAGKKIVNGVLSVCHNGVLIHDNFQVERKTGAGKPEGPTGLPTKLQDHSNPVRFRNIWLVDHTSNSADVDFYVTQATIDPINSPHFSAPIESPAASSMSPIQSVAFPISSQPIYLNQ
jgi:hypothetical protein